MLPDFPTARGEVNGYLLQFLKDRAREHRGVLQNVKHIVSHECAEVEQHRFDGSIDKQPLQKLGGQIKFDTRDIDRRGFVAVREAYELAAKQIAEKQSRFFFQRMGEILADGGQSFDAGGRPFTPEVYLEYLEKVDIEFDQDGEPVLPTLMCGSAHYKAIHKWDISDEQQKRFDELIEQKRLAWRDRESDRRLVD